MRKIFHKWLLLFISIAFLLTIGVSFYLQSLQAENNARALIRIKFEDIRKQIRIREYNAEAIRELTKDLAISKARLLRESIRHDPSLLQDQEHLKRLEKLLAVDEIHISDANGVLEISSKAKGFHLDSSPQSAAFLPGLSDPAFELAQDPCPRGIDKLVYQYAGLARLDKPGIIMVGFYPERLRDALNTSDIRNLSPGLRIGANGQVVICRDNRIVGVENRIYLGRTIGQFGIPPHYLLPGKPFFVVIHNRKYMGECDRFGEYMLIGLVPFDEMYVNRDAMVFFLIVCNILLFGIVFILVSELVQRVVIDGIDQVNLSLSRITNGDLEEKVSVRTSEEFTSLSDRINDVVNTMKSTIDLAVSRIDSELEFARMIQHSVLPQTFPPYPERKEFDVFAVNIPAREVGGDFYDFFMPDHNHLAALIADVSGKGIGAAMFMMTAKTLIRSLAESGIQPAEVFTEANKKLCASNEAGLFVTAFMVLLELDTGKLCWANAGHNPPLIMVGNGKKFEAMKVRPGFVLAGMDDIQYRQQEIILEPGAELFLYTDGVTEACNKAGELFGVSRMTDTLNRCRIPDLHEQISFMEQELKMFAAGTSQNDDITMLAIRFQHRTDWLEKEFSAELSQLENAVHFVTESLEEESRDHLSTLQLAVAVEEIFVNIANYAYRGAPGKVLLRRKYERQENRLTLQFVDNGKPYNPLEHQDPDITLSAEERPMGGLGIMMVKKSMDNVHYEYHNCQNIITLVKQFGKRAEKTSDTTTLPAL